VQKVSEYEQNAEECRKMASRMNDPLHKKQVEDMAEAWAMLARERAKRIARASLNQHA
jgi:Ca2+-binding EF-hand superfamily protein